MAAAPPSSRRTSGIARVSKALKALPRGNARRLTLGCSAAPILPRSPTAALFLMRPGPIWQSSEVAPIPSPLEASSREAPISLPCSQQAAPGPFPVSAASCWRHALRKSLLPCSKTSCLAASRSAIRSEEHTSELQSHSDLVCRLLLEKKKYIPVL